MGKKVLQSGNPVLFVIIKFLNLGFGVSALALIGLGIWLWREFGVFTILEILFMLLGLVEFLLVCLIFTAKTSVIKLRCYLFFMMALFVAQVTSIVIVFATGDGIINDLFPDSKQQVDKLKGYLNIVTYFCIGCLVLMIVQMALTYCYIGSLRDRNDEYSYKFSDEDGNKLSLQQKINNDKIGVSQKYAKKREEMMNKYDSYRNYKQQGN